MASSTVCADTKSLPHKKNPVSERLLNSYVLIKHEEHAKTPGFFVRSA